MIVTLKRFEPALHAWYVEEKTPYHVLDFDGLSHDDLKPGMKIECETIVPFVGICTNTIESLPLKVIE